MLVKGEEDSRVYWGKTVGTTQHKRRYDLCSNLSILKDASDMTLSQHKGGQISLWLPQTFEEGWSQLHDDFSITGPAAFEDRGKEQTSASRIETAPRASVQLVLNSLAVNFPFQFSIFLPAALAVGGFIYFIFFSALNHPTDAILHLFSIGHKLLSQHNKTGTSHRVKVLRKVRLGGQTAVANKHLKKIWILDVWKLPFVIFKYYNMVIMFPDPPSICAKHECFITSAS